MKIVLFTNSLAGGGAERAAATLANHWSRRGWEVAVVTLHRESDDFYQLDAQIKRISLNLAGDSSNAVYALLQNGRRILALRKLLKKSRPAVVLSLMSTPNVLLAFAAWGLSDVCAVGSEHEFPPHAPLGFIWTRLRRAMYGKLGAVVALTQECALWIKENSTARHVPVIPNPTTWPLPVHAPQVSPRSFLAPHLRVLLAVGRLDRVKNLTLLIDAFSRLANRHTDWNLVILGEGAERSALESMAQHRGLAQRIVMPGIVGNVGQWYEHADLYVMTSHSEGFPNTLAEALAHGLPAVSVDCDTGPRDIIRHGIDGLLVPVDDTGALADALDRLMNDDGLRATFSARALDAKERFSVEQIASRWEALFDMLSGTRGRSNSLSKARTAANG